MARRPFFICPVECATKPCQAQKAGWCLCDLLLLFATFSFIERVYDPLLSISGHASGLQGGVNDAEPFDCARFASSSISAAMPQTPDAFPFYSLLMTMATSRGWWITADWWVRNSLPCCSDKFLRDSSLWPAVRAGWNSSSSICSGIPEIIPNPLFSHSKPCLMSYLWRLVHLEVLDSLGNLLKF